MTTDTTTTLRLRGAFTALVTPFTRDGAVDEAAFVRLVERQIDLGIDGLVPCGTTGESPTTSHEEDDRLIGLADRDGRPPRRHRADPGHRRDRLQQHRDRRLVHPARRGPGRGRGPRGGAVLQQARPADARGALPDRRGRRRPARRRLQRAGPHRPPTWRRAPCMRLARAPAHRRGQGGVREPRADHDHPAGPAATASASCRATTRGPTRCCRWAATASSRWPRTRSPRRWRACARWRSTADGTRRAHSTSGCLELMRANFISPNPVPVKAALAEMGLIEDVLRQPLLPMADELRPRLRAALAVGGHRAGTGAGERVSGPRRRLARGTGRRARGRVAGRAAHHRRAPPGRGVRSSRTSSRRSRPARLAPPSPTRMRPAAGGSTPGSSSGILLGFRIPGFRDFRDGAILTARDRVVLRRAGRRSTARARGRRSRRARPGGWCPAAPRCARVPTSSPA